MQKPKSCRQPIRIEHEKLLTSSANQNRLLRHSKTPESSRLGWKTPLGSSRLAIAYLNTWCLPPPPRLISSLISYSQATGPFLNQINRLKRLLLCSYHRSPKTSKVSQSVFRSDAYHYPNLFFSETTGLSSFIRISINSFKNAQGNWTVFYGFYPHIAILTQRPCQKLRTKKYFSPML